MVPEFIRSIFPKNGTSKDYLKSIKSQKTEDFYIIEISMPQEKVQDLKVSMKDHSITFQLGSSSQNLFLHKNADANSLHFQYLDNKYQILLKRKEMDPVENINRLALEYV